MGIKVSYNDTAGLSDREIDAGLCWSMLDHYDDDRKQEKEAKDPAEAREASRFKEGAKIVAGLSYNKQIKLELIHQVYKEGMDSAIRRYMKKEALPMDYYPILKSQKCIDNLINGLLYKICHIDINLALYQQIANLSCTARRNPNSLSPYDRVTQIQQFIHYTVDQYIGDGAACLIPVIPMKNTLSAARLHLNIFDIINNPLVHTMYLNELATFQSKLEYDNPRPLKMPQVKRYYPRWRVRHLRPLSYFYGENQRLLMAKLMNVDENKALVHRTESYQH